MSAVESPGCPPLLVLERVLLGEPAGPASEHVHACPRCTALLAEMREQGQAYLRSARARELHSHLEALEKEHVGRGFAWWTGGWRTALILVPAAAVAIVALLVRPQAKQDDLRSKGGTGLELFVERGGMGRPWDGSPLAANDVLQLAWSSPEDAELAIIAREPDGHASVVFPEASASSSTVRAGHHVPLGGSLMPGGKALQLWVFSARARFELAPLVRAVESGSRPQFAGQIAMLAVPGTAR